MPVDVKKNRKEIARKLRKKGFSYSEIQKQLVVPKSTIASWVHRLKLSEEQKAKLIERRLAVGQKNIIRRSQAIKKYIVDLKNSSAKKVKQLSRRELWLLGIMLYWSRDTKDKSDNELKKGVQFSSSNPSLIQLFIKWLKEIGGITMNELLFDIFIKNNNNENDVKEYWSKKIGIIHESIKHVYTYRVKKERDDNYGFFRVRLRASSMLARQIRGWIEGIKLNILYV